MNLDPLVEVVSVEKVVRDQPSCSWTLICDEGELRLGWAVQAQVLEQHLSLKLWYDEKYCSECWRRAPEHMSRQKVSFKGSVWPSDGCYIRCPVGVKPTQFAGNRSLQMNKLLSDLEQK